MTDYKNIRGKKIKFFTTDLSNEQAEGQIFYSDTDNDFKTVVATAAWHSSGSLNTARKYLGGCGIQTAALAFGGDTGSNSASTEEYNGAGWAAGGDLNTARKYLAGCGTQTAGLTFGGQDPSPGIVGNTEEYNGSSWSEQNDLSTARKGLAGAGIQTAGLAFGGRDSTTHVANTGS